MQPGPSGRAAVSVLLDGKPVGEAHGMDVGTDGVARFDRSGLIRLVAGAPRRRHDHRGQLSSYLRPIGSTVLAIYGQSANSRSV